MAEAKAGDTVRVHYVGTLADGREFDSSQGRDPLEFTLGAGQVVPGFDRGVTGMEPGERRTLQIAAADAYGPRREEMVMQVPRDRVPPDLDPQVGQQLQMTAGDNVIMVTVTDVSDDALTLDANHRLAGEDLTFEVRLVEIV